MPNHLDRQTLLRSDQRMLSHIPGRCVHSVRPKRGRCLLFFPALVDGRCDEQTLHKACPAIDEKWVTQVWVRAHGDPLQLALRPPRWPKGCLSFADLIKLVF